MTDNSKDCNLALVFFDVLSLNSDSLLSTPYFRRREILESLIQPIPGKVMLSERFPIPMRAMDSADEAKIILERIFSDMIATHQEGIVLKGDETRYHDYGTPWVKLKKDYIPGYGDTLDLVIVGIGWDKSRARELRGSF